MRLKHKLIILSLFFLVMVSFSIGVIQIIGTSGSAESEYVVDQGFWGESAQVQVGGNWESIGDNIYFTSVWIKYKTTGGVFITVTYSEATFIGYYLQSPDQLIPRKQVLGFWSRAGTVDEKQSGITPHRYTFGLNGTCIAKCKNIITGDIWYRRATVELWLPHVNN